MVSVKFIIKGATYLISNRALLSHFEAIQEILRFYADEHRLEIPLVFPNVTFDAFREVLRWTFRHIRDPDYFDRVFDGHNVINQYDAEFLRINRHQIFELLQAAYELGIPKLHQIISITLAANITHKKNEKLKIPCQRIGEEDD